MAWVSENKGKPHKSEMKYLKSNESSKESLIVASDAQIMPEIKLLDGRDQTE